MDKQTFLSEFPKLIADYQPTTHVLERIADVELLIVIGPSGVGKSAVIDRLGLPFVPSDVTRGPRPWEVEGRDFYFRTDYDEIISDIDTGSFVQIAVSPDGEFYATRASSYPESGPASIPVVADVVPVFRELGFKKTTSIFITPPDYQEWMRRMNLQHLSAEQLQKRLNEADRSFRFALADNQIHFILNDDLEQAVWQTKDVLEGKTDKQREAAAREIAQELRVSIN